MLNGESWGVLLARWLILAASVWVAAEMLAGIELEGIGSTLAVAAILGLLNIYIRPVLIILTLPFTILTLGFFLVVVNALLLGLADWVANPFDDVHFEVESVGAALLGAVIISLVNMTLNALVKPSRFGERHG